MSVEAIAAIGAAQASAIEGLGVVPAETAAPGVFESVLDGLQQLNTQMLSSERATTQLALGQSDNLHQALIKSEQTRLEFELLMAVRNKVLDAYQELMRMQV